MNLLIFFIVLNILFIHSKFFGTLFALFYFGINGKRLGRWLFPTESLLWQTLAGVFFILSFFSLFGAIIYYIYRLDDLIFAILLIAVPFAIQRLNKKWPEPKATFNISKWIKIFSFAQTLTFFAYNKQKLKTFLENKILILKILYLLFFSSLYQILSQSITTDAIRSPWLIIPKSFFVIYILMTLCLIAILWKARSQVAIFFIILHAFISSSIALFIYKYGYGFDPFIHQAAEKVILEKGFILPKTLYYLGQYSLVVTLAKFFQIGVIGIDKLLVPVFFSLYIPLFLYYSLKKTFSWEQKYILLAILSLLVLPFKEFIFTTPQSMANIYAIIIIFLALLYSPRNNFHEVQPKKILGMLLFLNAVTIFIHPLTGIPVFIFLLFLFLLQENFRYRKLALIFAFIISGAALSITFFINSFTSSSLKIKLNFALPPHLAAGFANDTKILWLNALLLRQSNGGGSLWSRCGGLLNLRGAFKPLFFHDMRHYHLIRDFIYLYGQNIIPVFLLLILIGAILIFYKKLIAKEKFSIFIAYLITSLVIIINYVIIKNFLHFDLISYEQNSYSLRLLTISAYFILPFFVTCFYYFFFKLGNLSLNTTHIITGANCPNHVFCPFLRIYQAVKNYFTSSSFNVSYIKNFFLVFFALWLAASLYLTYPRYDDHAADRGYNVAKMDFEAAQFIEADAKDNFIVLANQSTAAAALTEYGFKKYYKTANGEIFYYPIPTSSPLYQYYLDMANYKPSRATMEKAMNLAGVREGYFVINNYWWHAGEIIETAKLEADEWKKIYEGKIYVFKYELD